MVIEKRQHKDIATWMLADKSAELPAVLQGVFFMDGNPLADDCLTMHGSKWDADSLTLLLPVFASRQWTFHTSAEGRRLLNGVKFARLTYSIRFEDETLQRAHITPIVFGLPIPKWIVDFLMYRDESSTNGDTWIRRNSWFRGTPSGGYTLRRIADKDGKHTPVFTDMQSKVDDECLVIAKE